METEELEDLEKPRRKSVSDSWKIDKESAKVRPELLPEKEEMPCPEQESQDKEPHRHTPLQRNSIFNRTVRHRSQAKARGASERNSSRPAGQCQGQRPQLCLHIPVG